ncbi:MAG: NapC/NirT family cytochrome c [Gammaproteobacteria bacterium]|nr:NapC/NirT family cytochrome c [Gammaproteobacteria bacterium]
MIRIPEIITRHVLIALLLGGVTGMAFTLFLIEFDRLTGTEAFCTGCHSMELVAVPYRESAHYNPVSGVRASCGDCHVSEGVFAATWDHIRGGKDLFAQLFGPDYDDPAINALHLPEAAFAVRQWFRRSDSATCKRCHTLDAINGTRADTLMIHQQDARGGSCIDCHYNLVHRRVPDRKTFKRDKWNRMIEREFDMPPGEADKLLRQ